MRLIGINNLQPNEKLGVTIFNQDGAVLLPANTVISSQYISRLKNTGITTMYIEDDFFEDVIIKPAIQDETKTLALGAVGNLYNAVAKNKPVNIVEVSKTVDAIVDDIGFSISEPISLINLYNINDKRVLHAVNVATIVCAMATCYYSESANAIETIKGVVAAGLAHDLFVDSMDEDKKNVSHPDSVYKFLKVIHGFSSYTYVCCHQHHEQFDGKGFPNRMSGDKINIGARLLAVADAYDNAVYGYNNGKPMSEHEAYEYVNSITGTVLDPEALKFFNSSIAIYPNGATVLLSNGYNAVVTSQTVMPARPKVRLCMPKREDCLLFDLTTEKTLFIEKILL